VPRGFLLTEPERRAVLRHLASGKSYSGTAVVTGIPRGTVGTIGRQAIVSGRLRPRSFGRRPDPKETTT
jgi:hypothetical protein